MSNTSDSTIQVGQVVENEKALVGKGLTVDRVYTKKGVHPYDEVEWERRDVSQNNWQTGETVFEQRGVEFPISWSYNASTIVTTKYFRGALHTEARETSLRQVIDRVVKRYAAAARQYNYMDDENATIFEHELTWMLLHQVFSFNSPVWFNVGTNSPQQVSACQPYHSLVSTPKGLIPIGKLVEDNAVGTQVYDAHGLTKILAVKNNGKKEVFRITTKAGHQLDVTADHLVWKATDGEGRGEFVPASTLRVNDSLSWHRQEMLGENEYDSLQLSEAALAGWMQSDGFVGQYDKGTNRSLTMEAITVNQEELDWVQSAINDVFGDSHRNEILVATQDESLDCRRTRLYGEHMRPFIDQYALLNRKLDMVVPEEMFTAPLPVVANYIRSVFQAEGFISERESSTLVAITMISEKLIRGIQALLLRFGIFSRVLLKNEPRPNRYDTYSLNINSEGDRKLFEEKIGFISFEKQAKLRRSFDKVGIPANPTKRLAIDSIESLGTMEVYDIQTESSEYLSGNIRVHNCFILAVEDNMDSILNWYKEEGFVFKGGSGAGLNLSKIRGSKEHLRTSGGMASGPVSFMRGADSSAGAIKSGGATRRAAKMVILDVDHPDIEEFIETKALEERKIKALRDAGFDMDLGGKDITSVQFQNANNSIRVSDKFLQAVEDGTSFDLIARLDGSVIETVDARTLWRKIAQAAWECADPGLQYDDTINHWHTNPNTGKINGSNPCSEYLSLDNSSCNLASLNLMKFQNSDGSFDSETFVKATEMVITAMEVSIAFADFPTEAITKNTKDYRQLGIGYANLGALLMSSGLAYDSTEGRAYAAAITSLMTGVSYRRSAEIAGIVGPYAGYAQNREPHIRVMEQHREAAKNLVEVFEGKQVDFIGPDIVSGTKVAQPIAELALQEWNHGLYLGVENGWRNAQASVLAPTGTISFMMDCDTTGVEPDFALTKFKKLVGGGSLTIVNTQVHPALRSLGYQGETIEAIEDFIAQNGHVNNAPGLKPEHYSVFDCAVGDRAISPNGHIRMMAAVQPFVSGAISKTVNLPDTATIEDIEKTYFDGWKLGLKAIAVYRDKCKVGQPLSDGKAKKSSQADEEITPVERIVERIIERPARRKLPAKRRAENTSFLVGGAEGYLTVGLYEDGKVGEVFIKMSKQGSTLSGIMDAFSISISMGLQYGVPLEAYVAKFTNMRFEPSGMTEDADVRMAQSLLDYIFRRIALDHLPLEVREGYGIYTTSERIQALNGENEITSVAQDEIFIEPHPRSESESGRSVRHTQSQSNVKTSRVSGDRLNQPREVTTNTDAPLCLTCGVKMRMAGSCFVCESCGSTSGCS